MDEDVPTIISFLVKFLRLSLSFMSEDCLREIGNGLSQYIDKDEQRDSYFSYENIFLAVDLEKGIREDVNLTRGNGSTSIISITNKFLSSVRNTMSTVIFS